MGRVVHFEITADDIKRAKKFYEALGWQIENANMPGADYWLAKTGEDSDMGINGAIMPRSYNPQPIIAWVSVDDIDDAIEIVKKAGGQTAGEKQTVPGIGQTIYVKDTEGNTIGLIEALPRQT